MNGGADGLGSAGLVGFVECGNVGGGQQQQQGRPEGPGKSLAVHGAGGWLEGGNLAWPGIVRPFVPPFQGLVVVHGAGGWLVGGNNLAWPCPSVRPEVRWCGRLETATSTS